MSKSFEQGPIRPPSESRSLLIRLTRNCNWNNCLFCGVYKGQTFSRRSVDEVKADIDVIAEIIEEARAGSRELGYEGQINQAVAQHFFNQNLPQSYLSVVAWLYYALGSVFIQDANNLILKADNLVEMLSYLNQKIEGITRITSYARSQTVARKTVEELTRIREAGLDRIHIGMESGSDQVLKLMKKGTSAANHIKAGQRAKAAGMEVSEYWMPGLGGRVLSEEHARESARVVNAINPDFVRLRSTRTPEQLPLYDLVGTGEFLPLTDDEMIAEIRIFIEKLDGIDTFIASDHIMNLLQDVEGFLPRDKDFMLEAIDRYLDLDKQERNRYRLGRRMGLLNGVADMALPEVMVRVDATMAKLQNQYPGRLDQILQDLTDKFI